MTMENKILTFMLTRVQNDFDHDGNNEDKDEGGNDVDCCDVDPLISCFLGPWLCSCESSIVWFGKYPPFVTDSDACCVLLMILLISEDDNQEFFVQ
jgi:hypothetical protein